MQALDVDALDLAESSLTFAYCDGGFGSFKNGGYLPYRVLPFALIGCLRNAVIRFSFKDKREVEIPSGRVFFIPAHRPHARTIIPNGLVESSWAHLHCTFLDAVDLFSYVHPPSVLPESATELFLQFNSFMTEGMGPIEYIIEQRIRHACLLLVASDKDIQEIAADMGYDNPFYFTRLFKKHTGTPPTAYRKAARHAHETHVFTDGIE